MKAFLRSVLALVALVLALAGPAQAASTIDVTINGFAFNPENVNIVAGDTVVWTNDDGVAHNVSGGSFSSGNFVTGTFTHTFTTPGTYEYFCTLHGSMRGSVIVADLPEPVIPDAPLAVLLPLTALGLGGLAFALRSRRNALPN